MEAYCRDCIARFFKSPFEQWRCLWALTVLDILVYEYPALIMVSSFFSFLYEGGMPSKLLSARPSRNITGIPLQCFPFCEGQTKDLWRRTSEITFLGWMTFQIYLPILSINYLQPIQQRLPTTGHLIPYACISLSIGLYKLCQCWAGDSIPSIPLFFLLYFWIVQGPS